MGKLLRLLVSGALLGWLAWRTDWAQVGHAFAHLRADLWLAALALFVATQGVSSLRWLLLARPLGFEHSFWRFGGYYFIGMYFNLVLPTSVGGDVVRAWYLDSGAGRRLKAFLSVFIDRLTGLLVLLALACAAVSVCPLPLPFWIPASVWGTAGCAAAGLVALPWLLRIWERHSEGASPGSFAARCRSRLRTAAEGLVLYRQRPRLLLATAGLSLIVQAANIVLVWLVGLAIGAPVPAAYYWVLVPMVSLLTLLPISVNGMGVREAGTVLFLAPLQVDQGTALTLAFLWFCVFTAASLLGGGVYLFGQFPRPEGRPDHETPVGGDPDQGRTGQLKAAA